MRFDELGQRIKRYEAQTTNRFLIPGLPVYARIDGRAFHTFCRGLKKPFCMELVETMQEVTKFLIEETNAKLGYVQSDEISLCWLDVDKAPFDGKLHKLESVLASLATSKFVTYIITMAEELSLQTDCDYPDYYVEQEKVEQFILLQEKVEKIIPSFDCRVFQLPNEMELANTFVWREIDAIRNSVSMLAQANFSHKELQGKDRKQMITMLEEKGIRWNELQDDLKRGAYFHRVLVAKELDDETWDKIPENKKPNSRTVIRSEIQRYNIPEMKRVENKVGVYFHDELPIRKYLPVWYIKNKNNTGYETRCPECGKKHYFSVAGDSIPCKCGAWLSSTKLSSLGSLDNYDTLIKEYSVSESN